MFFSLQSNILVYNIQNMNICIEYLCNIYIHNNTVIILAYILSHNNTAVLD